MKVKMPFDQILEIFRESNQENKKLLKFVFEKSDNISLWIIGLAIGGISIFANNIADIQKVISPCFLRPILLLLSISVTSGIIYRGLYLYFFVLLDNIYRGIDIAFTNTEMMDIESTLNGSETFPEVIEVLKRSGFREDLSYLIPVYEKINEEAKRELYDSVVNHYLNRVEFAQNNVNEAFDFVADTYSKFFGKSKEEYIKEFNGKSGAKKYKWAASLTSIFYVVYILAFISALFTFVLAT
jgi:hypothetical protein